MGCNTGGDALEVGGALRLLRLDFEPGGLPTCPVPLGDTLFFPLGLEFELTEEEYCLHELAVDVVGKMGARDLEIGVLPGGGPEGAVDAGLIWDGGCISGCMFAAMPGGSCCDWPPWGPMPWGDDWNMIWGWPPSVIGARRMICPFW